MGWARSGRLPIPYRDDCSIKTEYHFGKDGVTYGEVIMMDVSLKTPSNPLSLLLDYFPLLHLLCMVHFGIKRLWL